MLDEETLKSEIRVLQTQIDYKNEQYRTYEMYNEKVFRRKRELLGRQLHRLNKHIAEKFIELNKITSKEGDTDKTD